MHPNDTLNGELLAWEREDQKHLRGKLGYWRLVEERMVTARLRDRGVQPTYHAIHAEIAANHRNDTTHAQRSQIRAQSQAMWQQARAVEDQAKREAIEAAVVALRQIAGGHNDPRALADEVLQRLDALK